MKRFSLYRVHMLISIYVHCDLDLWPLTSKINRVHPLIMVNMSAKFDQEICNGLVSIMFTCLSPYNNYVHCDIDLWLLTPKINRVHPLVMVKMSAKFDKEICNGLVSIVFTSFSPYMSIMTLTFDLQNQ